MMRREKLNGVTAFKVKFSMAWLLDIVGKILLVGIIVAFLLLIVVLTLFQIGITFHLIVIS